MARSKKPSQVLMVEDLFSDLHREVGVPEKESKARLGYQKRKVAEAQQLRREEEEKYGGPTKRILTFALAYDDDGDGEPYIQVRERIKRRTGNEDKIEWPDKPSIISRVRSAISSYLSFLGVR